MHAYPRISVLRFVAFSLALTAGLAQAAFGADDPGWPREIVVPEGRILIYQPQLDTLEGNVLKGRSALSFTPKGKAAPVFGATWFEARVDIDRDERLVKVLSAAIPKCRFGESTPEQEKELAGIIEREVSGWDLTLSLDRMMASLKAAETERAQAEGVNNDPPKIYFETQPAVLIVLDGDPQTRPIEGAQAQRVVNTPYFMAFDPAARLYWTKAGPAWFSTANVTGAWKPSPAPSREIVSLQAQAEEEQKKNAVPVDESAFSPEEKEKLEAAKNDERVPKVIVSKVPAELIVADGEPQFSPLVGSDLLAMSNTDSDVFMEVGGQDYYVVISGRWYKAKSTSGPWTFVRSDGLPASFAKIAPGSDQGNVRTFVAGTDEAEDALIDAQIPQTAAVKRSEAKLTVTYDGDPRFEPVPNTSIRYALNTDVSVLLIDGKYYACKDAVWFVSVAPAGPWVLADSVPAEVRKIPPESPVYNVKYVYIYDTTPEVVYVGYLPGYVGCYPYYGTIVYGTGWYYRPWISPYHYYPRPVTYGFRVHYNPWYGWSFGVGMSYGWGSVTIGWGGGYHGGWWGPAGFYPRPPHHHHPGYGHPGYRPGHPGHHPPPPHGRPPGGVAGPRPLPANRPNLYARPSQTLGNGVVTKDKIPARQPSRVTKDPNNVFADKDGNVYRRDKAGNWDQRGKTGWKPAAPSTPSTRPSPSTAPQPKPQPSVPQAKPAPRPAPTPQLDRDYKARQHGSQRTQSFQQTGGGKSRPSAPKPAPKPAPKSAPRGR